MVGLLDISPSSKTVTVQGTSVPVSGVSVRGLAYLLGRFPEVRALFMEKTPEFTAERLTELVPDAIAAIIACGTGNPGNPDAERIAESLAAGDQLELLSAILEQTMPNGAGPFVEKLTALAASVGGGGSGKVPAST
jgi:hypothetical protein